MKIILEYMIVFMSIFLLNIKIINLISLKEKIYIHISLFFYKVQKMKIKKTCQKEVNLILMLDHFFQEIK